MDKQVGFSSDYMARFAGSLSSELDISEIIQLAGRNMKLGLLTIFGDEENAKIYFNKGNIVSASCGHLNGYNALVETISWKHGGFIFEEGLTTNNINIGRDYSTALLNAVKKLDERNFSPGGVDSLPDAGEVKSMTSLKEQLEDFLKVEGVITVVVVGRDGFIIDAASKGDLNIDDVGAVVSTGMGSSESMGIDLRVGNMNQGMLEYENGIIFMREISEDAILVVVSTPGVNLGMIRFQMKKRMADIVAALE
jgi:predicted regulator of Ras-like GTPase activity (Roadblock/LC7/MglB family)